MKDIAGKMQCLLYGRGIYSYYSDSIDGEYKAHLENVDVYDFLIDPSAGGLDVENANYMGRYGVKKNAYELKQGVKNNSYLKYEVANLLESKGNAGFSSQEETNKQSRRRDQNVWTTQVDIQGEDNYVFWEWYTTHEGKRYYMLLTENGGCAIKVEELTTIFPATKQHPLGAFPFWTYAYVPNLTEFWTPSAFDKVREVIMAQQVSINQSLDNSEQINKPMKIVSVGMIEDIARLKYRKDGIVPVKGEFDVNKAVQILQTPQITAPITMFNLLEGIRERSSGVTSGANGQSNEDKVGIYEGNQANAADRFGLFNKSYSFGYTRFGMLHDEGMRCHLTKKVAIQILGPNGIEEENISKSDIYRKNEDMGISVESSNAELALSENDKKNKLSFLVQEVQNQTINPKKATEMRASIVGFSEDEIKQLMDTSDFADSVIVSEADRDIEALLDGKKIRTNRMATTAYKQRFVDFMLDNEDDMSDMQKERLFMYMETLEPVIITNMMRKVTEKQTMQALIQAQMPPEAPQSAPMGNPEVTDVTAPEMPAEPLAIQ